VHDINAVFTRQGHNALEEIKLDALRRRVGGKVDNKHLGLGNTAADGFFQLREKIHPGDKRHALDIRARDNGTVDMDGIAGVRHENAVAAVQRGQHQVRDAFFRTDGRDGFGFRVEIHVVAGFIPVADGAAKARNAFRHGVAVRVAALRGLDQLGHDVGRRGAVRVAHAEVDDVLATAAGGHFKGAGDVENVGGKALDPGKFRRKRRIGLVAMHGAILSRKRLEPSKRRAARFCGPERDSGKRGPEQAFRALFDAF